MCLSSKKNSNPAAISSHLASIQHPSNVKQTTKVEGRQQQKQHKKTEQKICFRHISSICETSDSDDYDGKQRTRNVFEKRQMKHIASQIYIYFLYNFNKNWKPVKFCFGMNPWKVVGVLACSATLRYQN